MGEDGDAEGGGGIDWPTFLGGYKSLFHVPDEAGLRGGGYSAAWRVLCGPEVHRWCTVVGRRRSVMGH